MGGRGTPSLITICLSKILHEKSVRKYSSLRKATYKTCPLRYVCAAHSNLYNGIPVFCLHVVKVEGLFLFFISLELYLRICNQWFDNVQQYSMKCDILLTHFLD